MRILGRYVLREFLVPLAYTLAGFFAIYVLFELFSSFGRIASASPDPALVVRYFLAYFAPQFKWFAPACLMLATLYTMWSFCRHSEIIAMRASGVGFFAIVKPILLTAIAMAAFTFWVDERYVPVNAQWAKDFRAAKFRIAEMEDSSRTVFRNPRANRTWQIAGFEDAAATRTKAVSVAEDWPGGGRRYTLASPRAEWRDGMWWFRDPSVTWYSPTGEETDAPSPDAEKLTYRPFDFEETPQDFLLQNRDDIFYSVSDRFRYLAMNPSLDEGTKREFVYNAWAQMLAPLACIVIALFAIPAGVATGRQSVFKGVVGALAMFFAFYALTIACMVAAQTGYVPPVAAAAAPHAAFFAAGCWLFRRQR